jgi:hypothetical protein
MPQLSEILYGVKVEGMKVKIASVEGALLTITALGFIEDAEWPGVVVVFTNGEQKGYFECYSRIVLETLEKVKDAVPFEAMFLKQKSAADRTFWTVE